MGLAAVVVVAEREALQRQIRSVARTSRECGCLVAQYMKNLFELGLCGCAASSYFLRAYLQVR